NPTSLPGGKVKSQMSVYARCLLTAADNKNPAQGEVWATRSPSGELKLVLLVSFSEHFNSNPTSIAQIRPISKRCVFASSHDLAFDAEDSPMRGVPLMIECWNPRPILRRALIRPVGKISALALTEVRYLSSCVLHGVEPNRVPRVGFIGTSL